jgi:iron complex outermembrane receptor protein
LHFHPHPLDWLHYETSFETVTGKTRWRLSTVNSSKQLNNTIRTEFSINWLDQGFATLNLSSTLNNVSGFETSTNGYTLVNFLWR